MNRLQKKCFICSAGVHLLLFSILFVGPAFLSSKPTPTEDLPLLDFIPLKTTDDLMSGGGNPNANSAPPGPKPEPPPQQAPQQPPQQAPQKAPEPAPPKRTEPEAVKEPPKEPDKPADETADVSDKKPKREFKLVPTVRKPQASAQAKREAEANERAARQAADVRRKAVQEFARAADVVGNGLSAGTSVEMRGPGGGGVPYANFLQGVQTIYQRAWRGRVPAGSTDRTTAAIAAVTIARDGTVLAARIIERSGNSKVDNAVQSTLDYIRHAVPLPDDAKESQRTVTISFDVEAKKGL
jgi:outer membrane biosynthesis protein TonB